MSGTDNLSWMVRHFSQPARAQMICFLSWNDFNMFSTFSYKENHMHLSDEKFFEQFHPFIFLTKFAMHNPNVWQLMNKFQLDLNRLNLEWLTHVHQPMIEQLELNWSLYDPSHPFWSVVLKCQLSEKLMMKYYKHVDLLMYFQRNGEQWKPEYRVLLREPDFHCFTGFGWSPQLRQHLKKNASFLNNVIHLLGEKDLFNLFKWPVNDTFETESSPIPCFKDDFFDVGCFNNVAVGYNSFNSFDAGVLHWTSNDIFVPRELLKCVFTFLKATEEAHILFFSDMLVKEFPEVFWSFFFSDYSTFIRLSRSHWLALFMKCKTLGKIRCDSGMKFLELLDPAVCDFKIQRKQLRLNWDNRLHIVENYSRKMNLKLSWPIFGSLDHEKIPTLPWSFEEMCDMCSARLCMGQDFDEAQMLIWLKLWFSSNANATTVELVSKIDTESDGVKDDVFSVFARWAMESMKPNDVEFKDLNVNKTSDIIHFLSHPFHVRLSAWKRDLLSGCKDKNLTRMFVNTLNNDQWLEMALSMKNCFNEHSRPFFEVHGETISFHDFCDVLHEIMNDLLK